MIFYGLQYRMWWEQIAAASFAPTERGGLYALATPQTLFIMIKGPTTPGITNEYFVQAGEFVQRHLGGAGTAGETLNR